ncbi:MAG: hypothetical protein RRY79_05050 [Clostridia bacterium]
MEVNTMWFIRDSRYFVTRSLHVLSFDVVLADIFGDKSMIIAKNDPIAKAGDIVSYKDQGLLVNGISSEDGGRTMELSCSSLDELFLRPVYTHNINLSDFASTETFIKSIIVNHFLGLDPAYDLSFLELPADAAMTATPLIPPELGDYSMVLTDYIHKVSRLGVATKYMIKQGKIIIDISARVAQSHTLDLTGHEVIEDYAEEGVAKISNFTDDGVTDYYLLVDGTMTTTPGNAVRASGAWQTMQKSDADKVSAEFAKNKYGHRIEFLAREKYCLMDNMRIKTPSGRIIHTFVSAIGKTSTDSRYKYTCGEVAQNLTVKLREGNE